MDGLLTSIDGLLTQVVEYARFLGIDPLREPHLLAIAQEGLVAPLPDVRRERERERERDRERAIERASAT